LQNFDSGNEVFHFHSWKINETPEAFLNANFSLFETTKFKRALHSNIQKLMSLQFQSHSVTKNKRVIGKYEIF
jgi:hypothetical protein